MIQNWRAHGAISRPAKTAAIVAMAAVLAISMAIGAPLLMLAVQALVMAGLVAACLTVATRLRPRVPAS